VNDLDPTVKIAELRALLADASADIIRRDKVENSLRGRLNMALGIIEDLRAGRPVADWRLDLLKPTPAAKP